MYAALHVTETICFMEQPRLQSCWGLDRTSAHIQFYERYSCSFHSQHSDSYISPAQGNLPERRDLRYSLRYVGCDDYIRSRADYSCVGPAEVRSQPYIEARYKRQSKMWDNNHITNLQFTDEQHTQSAFLSYKMLLPLGGNAAAYCHLLAIHEVGQK